MSDLIPLCDQCYSDLDRSIKLVDGMSGASVQIERCRVCGGWTKGIRVTPEWMDSRRAGTKEGGE